MKSLQRSMKQAQRAVKQSTRSLEETWKELGVAVLDAEQIDGDTLSDPIDELADTVRIDRANIEKAQQDQEAIRRSEERRRSIQERLTSIPKEIAAIEEANRPIYRVVGEQTLALYGARELADQRLAELLSEPRALSRRIADIKRTFNQLQGGAETGIGGKLTSRLKTAALLPKQAVLNRSLASACEKLGNNLLNGTILQELGDPDIESVAAGYYENQRHVQALTEEREQLESERADIQSRLDELQVEKSPQSRLDQLELRCRSLQKDMDGCLVKIGKHYFQNSNRSESPQGVDDLIRRIQDLTSAVQAEQHRIERLEAAIQIEQLSAKRRSTERRMQLLKGVITEKQQELDGLIDELEDSDREVARLKAVCSE